MFCILKTFAQGGGSSTQTPASPLRNQSADLAAGDSGRAAHSSIDLTINQIKEMGSALDKDNCFSHKHKGKKGISTQHFITRIDFFPPLNPYILSTKSNR